MPVNKFCHVSVKLHVLLFSYKQVVQGALYHVLINDTAFVEESFEPQGQLFKLMMLLVNDFSKFLT